MERQIRICVLLSIILILLVFIFVKMRNEDKLPKKDPEVRQNLTETQNTEDAVEISQELAGYKYFIIEEDGRLTVYETATETIFLETDIETEFLPADILGKLHKGIYFETEMELFNFLESYSS